jgi:chemotaxis protein MotA
MKRKLDLSTLIGMLLAIGGIGVGYFLEGGDFKALVKPSPIIIIFGGTFGAVIITQPIATLKQIPGIFRAAFTDRNYNYIQLIEKFCEYAKTARTQGVVALDNIKDEIEDPFVKKGLTLVIDSMEPEDVKAFLETEISSMEQRHSNNAKMFSAAGGFAPTMGIIGTVLGLVIILAGLEGASIGELGHGIATAFLATFMGVASANLIYLPLDSKLKMKSQQEVLFREIALQGILAIQAQESPIVLRKRLLSLLPEYMKAGKEEL